MYFVAPGSAFEVSLFSLHRKQIQIALAKPHLEMFVELHKSANSMLTVNYNYFKFTDEYRSLATLLLMEAKKRRKGRLLSLEWLSGSVAAIGGTRK